MAGSGTNPPSVNCDPGFLFPSKKSHELKKTIHGPDGVRAREMRTQVSKRRETRKEKRPK